MVRMPMKIFIIFLLLGLFCVGMTAHYKILGQHKVLPGPVISCPQKLKQKMLYHGPYSAWMDAKGTWFFSRDGKACVLHDPLK